MTLEEGLSEKVHQLFISEDLSDDDRMFLNLETIRLIRAEQKAAYEQGRKDALEKVRKAHIETFARHGTTKHRFLALDNDLMEDIDDVLAAESKQQEGASK